MVTEHRAVKSVVHWGYKGNELCATLSLPDRRPSRKRRSDPGGTHFISYLLNYGIIQVVSFPSFLISGGTVDECEVDIAVVIVVVLVIFAWLTGYLCLQKVEERKLKIQKKTNTCSNMKLDCVGQY